MFKYEKTIAFEINGHQNISHTHIGLYASSYICTCNTETYICIDTCTLMHTCKLQSITQKWQTKCYFICQFKSVESNFLKLLIEKGLVPTLQPFRKNAVMNYQVLSWAKRLFNNQIIFKSLAIWILHNFIVL